MKIIALEAFSKNVSIHNAVFPEIPDLINHITPDRILNAEF